MPDRPRELFLSHAFEDGVFASRIASVLRKHGVPVWYSEADIRGGQQWIDEIGVALRRCDWFAVLGTPRSVAKMWVKRETDYALRRDKLAGRIVPIFGEECDLESLSWVLTTIEYVDMRRSFDEGCRELLGIWEIRYRGE